MFSSKNAEIKKINDKNQAEAGDIKFLHRNDCVVFFATLLAVTSISLVFREVVANPDLNVTMFYIIGIVIVARNTNGYIWGFLYAFASVISVNYFFTYPYHNFNMTLQGYPITFVAMFFIYIFTSAMTVDIKVKAQILAKQEKELAEAQKEKMRANLLRAVSHDLRTPLTGIIGNSETYLEMEETLSAAEKREIVKTIENDANWLLNMVENLLSVTRINNETAEVTKSLEEVDEVVSSAIVRFRKRFPEAQLKVFPPEEYIMVMMDPMLIEQVLINILQNAQIHSRSKKPIELIVEDDVDKVWFTIKDYGVGISDEKMDTLFDGEGYNKESETETDGYKGMGIGLSICKTIVKVHGGDIRVRNHSEGSEFYFYLPKEEEENDYDA